MFLVVEKMGAAAVDEEEDEVALVFWRLGGGAVAALLVPVVVSVSLLVDIFWKRGFGRGFGVQDPHFFDELFAKLQWIGGYLDRIERKQEKQKQI